MSKKNQFLILFLIFSLFGIAQTNLNNYKYIIVPKKFDFLKYEDQYQLNSITKFLFNKYGFEAYFLEDDLPEDFKTNRCLGLTADASNSQSGMFKTKIEIVLKDCFGKTVMTSKVGESRLKEYKKAYNEAIREALKTFNTIDYAYAPVDNQTLPLENLDTQANVVNRDTETSKPKDAVVVAALPENNKEELYYAQPIKNGFQLVNAEPKIVMILLETSAEQVFIVKGKSAIVYEKDGFWYYSENTDVLKEKKLLNIKF